MGGRIHGFLGGILLTGSIAYLTGETFKSNQAFISHELKEAQSIIDDRNKPLPMRTNSVDYNYRPGVMETAKDIWNAEVIKAVNWLYGIQWVSIGKGIERKLEEKIEKSV